MKQLQFFLLLISINSFCQEMSKNKSIYPNRIGDIDLSKETIKPGFDLCATNKIIQYFNNSKGLEYEGEKLGIEKVFFENYKFPFNKDETGLIRIRFIVNCKGETDGFTLLAVDENYHEKTFTKAITDQLLSITKNLKGWKPKTIINKETYYYQYLIFKLENGQLKEILP